jgi:hypothetical protein
VAQGVGEMMEAIGAKLVIYWWCAALLTAGVHCLPPCNNHSPKQFIQSCFRK